MKITAKNKKNYQVEVSARAHNFIMDEPFEDGGDDFGPTPKEMLISALAGCKIITVQMYAKRKAWPLTDVKVKISSERIYGKDCEDCVSEGNTKVDLITVEIEFMGDLTEEQKLRLHEIAGRCPIHRTLTTETKIRSKLII
jgi:uncharacterized OsmC-like protein